MRPPPPPVDLSTPRVMPEEMPAQMPTPADTPDSTETSSRESAPAPTTGMPLETIHEKPGEHEDVTTRHPLMRRRSSLKQKSSMHSLASQAKSVTWAMDRDWTEQTSRLNKVANEADVLAYELDQARAQYHEEMAMMRIVCQDAVRAAEKLSTNVGELKQEETALALQQYKVASISEAIEEREARYREAVCTVLEETKRIVQLCDKKRESHEEY
ncbi:hypothetical protein NM688_g705 [Phlebia brevispora]|uniref:Uncharacterized protein n=1 Tax=Phlebia brevispora TaxID=194682 RepID=A0ACC1TD93_9APHY|nr:hypothetical protein NM688_g705 [Phlebia brevispora]